MVMKQIVLGLAACLGLVGAAKAELLQYQFNDPNGQARILPASATHANPVGVIELALSAGIDRRIRATVMHADGKVLYQETSGLLGANDRITVDGKSYYGTHLRVSAPPEGQYTVRAEILTSDGNSTVRVDDYPLTVDTTPPAAGAWALSNKTFDVPYGWETSGAVWHAGCESTGGGSNANIVQRTGMTDPSGLSSAYAESFVKETGELAGKLDLQISPVAGMINAGTMCELFPSGYQRIYTVKWHVTDNAGNTRVITQDMFWDNYKALPQPYAVYREGGSNDAGIPNFEPYTPGMTVQTNPLKVIFKIPDSNWHATAPGGIIVHEHPMTLIKRAGGHHYLQAECIIGNIESCGRMADQTSWSIGYVGQAINVVLGERATVSPAITKVEYNYSDIGWGDQGRRVPTPNLPVSVQGIRVNVEPRPYVQRAWHTGGTCLVAPGQTSCIVPWNFTMAKGTWGYIHGCCVQQGISTTYSGPPLPADTDGPVRVYKHDDDRFYTKLVYPTVTWNDVAKPQLIKTVKRFPNSLEATIVYAPEGGMQRGLGMKSIEARSGNRYFSSTTLSISGDSVERTVLFNLADLSDGEHDIQIIMTDAHENVVTASAGTFVVDKSAPEITLSVKDGDSVQSLDDIAIRIVDADDPSPRLTSISLRGGPANDNVQLSWRETAPSKFNLEYPVMFPSLVPDELYYLVVQGEDAEGNKASASLRFLYSPRMVGLLDSEDGKINLPAVPHVFTRASGRSVLYTEALTFAEGAQVSGTYDVYATLRSDAEVPLIVNGVRIDPGATMEILPAHDFAASNGRLELDVAVAEAGRVGRSSILVTTVAPNAPVLLAEVRSWMPEVSLRADDWSVYPALQPVAVSASVPASTPCLLTASPGQAMEGNDPIATPRCLLRWTQVPDELYALGGNTEGAGLNLQGFVARTGVQKIGYEVAVLDADGFEVVVEHGSRDLEVLMPDGSVTLGLKQDPGPIERMISPVSLQLERKSGLECALTTDEDEAIDRTAIGRPTCLVTWKTVPSGLKEPLFSTVPALDGTVDESENTEASLRWELSAFTPSGVRVDLGSQALLLELVDPAAPTIEVEDRQLIVDDLYSAPRYGGYIGDFSVEGRPGDIVLATSAGGELIESEVVSPNFSSSTRARRQIHAEAQPLWTVTDFHIAAHYQRLPRVASEKRLRLLTVPSEDLRPVAVPDRDASLNTEALGVNVSIEDPFQSGRPYDVAEVGQWEVRLLNYISYARQEPLTEYVLLDEAGQARFELDLKQLEAASVRIMAKARLISPVPAYQRTALGARPLYISILRGEAIGADIDARRIKGEAPLSFMAKLDLASHLDIRALGDVVWELREEGTGEWAPAESNSSLSDRFQYTFAAGQYALRARVFNKHSGAEFVTEPIEIHAYNVPVLKIGGPANAFIGHGARMRIEATHRGEPVSAENLVVQWSEDDGKTWFDGGIEHTVVRDQAERVMVVARVRMADSPEDWQDAYVQRRYRVAFRPVSPPRGSIIGSRVIEEGKPVTWRGQARPPYPRMEVDIRGRFLLPDGSVVDAEEVEYLPTATDAQQNRVELIYEAWIEGLEDQGGKAAVRRFINVWQYRWPDWNMGVRISASQAPAQVDMRVRKPVGMGRYLEGVNYEWEIPAGVEVVQARTAESRSLSINEPGTYPITVRITDERGHATELVETLVIDAPDPWEVDFRISSSNADNRAPLDVRLSPSVRGGHPRDRITVYRYLLNGEPISEGLRYSGVELSEGQHELALEIQTEFGEMVSGRKEIEVHPNTPPVCELSAAESRRHMRFTARCTDETGRVVRHRWTVNGEEIAISGSRISVGAREDMALHVTLVAVDDGGAESAVVSWHGSVRALDE